MILSSACQPSHADQPGLMPESAATKPSATPLPGTRSLSRREKLAGGSQDGVEGIALLDGGAAAHLALDGWVDAAFLAAGEDPELVALRCVMAAIAGISYPLTIKPCLPLDQHRTQSRLARLRNALLAVDRAARRSKTPRKMRKAGEAAKRKARKALDFNTPNREATLVC